MAEEARGGRATLTVRAAAVALDVHENTIRAWMREGILESKAMPRGRFHRPYADSVASLLLTQGESAGLAPRVSASMLEAEADWMEERARALRRAAEILGESEEKGRVDA